jgi:hypothetical protein
MLTISISKRFVYNHMWISGMWIQKTKHQSVEKFPSFCGSLRFITVFTRTCHMLLFWTRLIWSMPPTLLLYDPFNTTLPSKPISSKWSLSLKFICTSYLPWLLHWDNTWWEAQTMNLLKQFLLVSCYICMYVHPLPQHPIPELPKPMFLP